jgi:hypothetical protein
MLNERPKVFTYFAAAAVNATVMQGYVLLTNISR